MRCFLLADDPACARLEPALSSADCAPRRLGNCAELSRETRTSGPSLVVLGEAACRELELSDVQRDGLSLVVWAPDAAPEQKRAWLERGAIDVWDGSEADLTFRALCCKRVAKQLQRGAARVRALTLSRGRYRSLVQNALDIIAVLDHGGVIRYASPALGRVLGYESHEVRGVHLDDIVHPEDIDAARSALVESNVPGVSVRAEFRVRHKQGHWRYVEAVADNLVGYPSVSGIVVNARDVTDRHDLEQMLMHQAFFDGLTGLPNRALFMDRAEHALAQQQRASGAPALLFIDLDGFKDINDSFGHDVGDAALVAVARRIESLCRAGDTAARLGGDEFTLLLESVESRDAALHVAERVIQSLRRPLPVGDLELHVTVSVGVACFEEGMDAKELVRRADTAMYRAKEMGKDQFLLWVPRHDAEGPPRLPTPPP